MNQFEFDVIDIEWVDAPPPDDTAKQALSLFLDFVYSDELPVGKWAKYPRQHDNPKNSLKNARERHPQVEWAYRGAYLFARKADL